MSQPQFAALTDRDVNTQINSNNGNVENAKMQGEQHKAVSGLNGYEKHAEYLIFDTRILTKVTQQQSKRHIRLTFGRHSQPSKPETRRLQAETNQQAVCLLKTFPSQKQN